jgi:hypothetical protein
MTGEFGSHDGICSEKRRKLKYKACETMLQSGAKMSALGLGRVKTIGGRGPAACTSPKLATISGGSNFADRRRNGTPIV